MVPAQHGGDALDDDLRLKPALAGDLAQRVGLEPLQLVLGDGENPSVNQVFDRDGQGAECAHEVAVGIGRPHRPGWDDVRNSGEIVQLPGPAGIAIVRRVQF